MATKQVSDAIAPGEIVSVEKCAVVEIGNRDDDVVVKFDSSPFEYCLPGSAIRRIPPAQAEPVAVKINADNPSTVPERFRQCMIDAAEYIVPRAMNTPGAGCTTKEGVLQMLTDLLALSLNDGCVAAAWAFEQIVQSAPKAEPVEAKEPWKPKPNEPLLVAAIAKQWCGDKWIIEIDGKAAWQGVDNQLIVNASQLRPLPVVQGGD